MAENQGNVELAGFRDLDQASMDVVVKHTSNAARKLSGTVAGFETLKVTMKPVHETEKSEKYELHVNVIASGKTHAVEVTDRNLFAALDSALQKIESVLS